MSWSVLLAKYYKYILLSIISKYKLHVQCLSVSFISMPTFFICVKIDVCAEVANKYLSVSKID